MKIGRGSKKVFKVKNSNKREVKKMRKLLLGLTLLIAITSVISIINIVFDNDNYCYSLNEKVIADDEPTKMLYWNPRDGYYCDKPAWDCYEIIVDPPQQ